MTLFRRFQVIRDGKGLRTELIRGGIGSVVIRVVHLILEFTLAMMLARILGAHDYGIYAYAFAQMRILAIPAQAGLPTLAVREVAAYQARKEWAHLRGLLIRMNQITFSLAVLIGIIAAFVAWVLMERDWTEQYETFLWALVLLPLMALGNIRGSALRGLHRVVLGQLPENVLRPGFFVFLILASTMFAGSVNMMPSAAMAMHAVSAAIAFGIGAWLLMRYLPENVKSVQPMYESRRWIRSAIPLSMIMGLMVINNQSAMIVLGIFSTPADVGLFGVALQVALVVTVPLTAVNVVIAPHISHLNTHGDLQKLRRVSTWSARIILLASLAIGAMLLVFGELILRTAFGEEFVRAYFSLAILCVGHCLGATVGASMILLNMTGNERRVRTAFAVAATINVLCSLVLIPILGLIGAAISVALSLTILNFTLGWSVQKWLRINPTAFSRSISHNNHHAG